MSLAFLGIDLSLRHAITRVGLLGCCAADIDSTGVQQGPHALGQMQSWYAAGYFPAGTVVAEDGGDQWVDVAQCTSICKPDAMDWGGDGSAAESVGVQTGLETELEQRKRALGFGGASEDAQRRSAGSSQSDPKHKRMRGGEQQSGTNAIPLGKTVKKQTGVTTEGERQRAEGEAKAFGLPPPEPVSDSVVSGKADEKQADSDSPAPVAAPAKKGRNSETGFGKWQTVTYKTAYTVAPEDDPNVNKHGYKALEADPDEVPSDHEEATVETRTVWSGTNDDATAAVSSQFQKRKVKGKGSRRRKLES